jgi:hypothetical protein
VMHRTSYYLPLYLPTRCNTKLCYDIRRQRIVYTRREGPILRFERFVSLVEVSTRRAVKVQTVSRCMTTSQLLGVKSRIHFDPSCMTLRCLCTFRLLPIYIHVYILRDVRVFLPGANV